MNLSELALGKTRATLSSEHLGLDSMLKLLSTYRDLLFGVLLVLWSECPPQIRELKLNPYDVVMKVGTLEMIKTRILPS